MRRIARAGPAPGPLGLLVLGVLAAGCGARSGPDTTGRSITDTAHIVSSTRLGGRINDLGRDLAFAPDGDLIVGGTTRSPDFPTTPGSYSSPFYSGAHDAEAWVVRYAPDGTLRWSTLLGGPNYERIYGLEIDRSGDIVVAGRGGAGMPITPGVLQPRFGGGDPGSPYGEQDGFVCKLSGDGATLRFCTYFGTEDNNIIRDVAVDTAGYIYVAAGNTEGEFPAEWFANAYQPRRRGSTDVVIAKIAPDGSHVVWATFLGGTGEEIGAPSVRAAPDGSVYVLLSTRSADLPTPNGFDHTLDGDQDLYIGRLSADGSRLLFGTYMGGSGHEAIETHGLDLDAEGNVFAAGGTSSRDFPTTPGAYRPAAAITEADSGEAFIVKLAPDGTLLAATMVGGRGREWGEGLSVDPDGAVYLTGGSDSPDLGETSPGDGGSGNDLYLVKLSPGLDRLLYAAKIGGATTDMGRASAATRDGQAAVTGVALSSDWPLRRAAQPERHGPGDAVVVRFHTPR